jgi:hypothetical protein
MPAPTPPQATQAAKKDKTPIIVGTRVRAKFKDFIGVVDEISTASGSILLRVVDRPDPTLKGRALWLYDSEVDVIK